MKTITQTIEKPALEIWHDDCPESPREWDNLGTMLCVHQRYNLGDHSLDSWEHVAQHLATEAGIDRELYNENMDVDVLTTKIEKSGGIVLPLYLYDHSGITMNTTGFTCRWDSGQVGVIYVTGEKIKREYGKNTKKQREKVRQYLINEVGTYDSYLRGEVYGFTLYDNDGAIEDSCGGFYDLEDMKGHLPEEWVNEDLEEYLV